MRSQVDDSAETPQVEYTTQASLQSRIDTHMLTLVSYDLRKPGKDYTKLYEALKALGADRLRPLESVWLFQTQRSASDLYAALEPHIDPNDLMFIAGLKPDTNGQLRPGHWAWIQARQ